MALAKSMRGTRLLIKIGDGAVPEVFTHNCSINAQRAFTRSSQLNEFNVPDCNDPDLMAVTEREKVSLSSTITGSGILNTPDVPFFNAYYESASPKNVRVAMDQVLGADGGGFWSGAFLLESIEFSGDRGGKTEVTLTLQSTGAITFTANA
jgi:hypothetical protein